MGIHDASQRTKTTTALKEKDFYQTPYCATRVLVDHLLNYEEIDKNISILDPCTGFQAISNILRKRFSNVVYYDKFIEHSDYELTDFLETEEKYDCIIMNPPYSAKNEFIDHAKTLAKDVYAFLPVQVDNYISFNENYLDIFEYCDKIKCYPKMFLSEKQKYVQGGVTAYAWYHWRRDHKGFMKPEYFYDLRNYMEESL